MGIPSQLFQQKEQPPVRLMTEAEMAWGKRIVNIINVLRYNQGQARKDAYQAMLNNAPLEDIIDAQQEASKGVRLSLAWITKFRERIQRQKNPATFDPKEDRVEILEQCMKLHMDEVPEMMSVQIMLEKLVSERAGNQQAWESHAANRPGT